MFLDHTQRRTTVGRTPLEEWSARRRDLYLTTHDTQQTNIHAPVGFEPTISAGERPAAAHLLIYNSAGVAHLLKQINNYVSIIDRGQIPFWFKNQKDMSSI